MRPCCTVSSACQAFSEVPPWGDGDADFWSRGVCVRVVGFSWKGDIDVSVVSVGELGLQCGCGRRYARTRTGFREVPCVQQVAMYW